MVAIKRGLFPSRNAAGAELLQSITFSLTVLSNSELQQVADLVDQILKGGDQGHESDNGQAAIRDTDN